MNPITDTDYAYYPALFANIPAHVESQRLAWSKQQEGLAFMWMQIK